MLLIDGSNHVNIKRIAWDGSSVADTGHRYTFDGVNGHFPTGNTEADEIFVNLKYGIRIGWAAETTIERNQFTGMLSAGVSVEDWNALDIWVRDSTFTDCRVGLTNRNLAGHFHAYNNLFVRSQVADMEMANTSYFSERGNTSVDSATFFLSHGIGSNPAQVTLQDNLIVHPKGTPIVIGSVGPLMLLDNTFVGDGTSTFPIIEANDWKPTDIFTIANKFDRSNVISGFVGRKMSIDDQQIDTSSVVVDIKGPAEFQPNFHRLVFEITPATSVNAIQSAVDKAAQLNGTRPAVHMQAGIYSFDRTLLVRSGSDLQLVGDGNASTYLNWTGKASAPLIKTAAPSRAAVRDIGLNGQDVSSGIEVRINDTPGSRVRLSNAETNPENLNGFISRALDHTIVEVLSAQFYGANNAVAVVGGVRNQSGQFTLGRTSLFGSTSGSMTPEGSTFSVSGGGTLTVFDNWRDTGSSSPSFMSLQGTAGHIALDGGVIATPSSTAFNVRSFIGDLSLVATEFNGEIGISGDTSKFRVMALGVTGDVNCEYWHDKGIPQVGVLALSQCRTASSGVVSTNSVGLASPEYVRSMLSRIRHVRPQPLGTMPKWLSDFHLENVYFKRTTTAITLLPAANEKATIQGYCLTTGGGKELVPVMTTSDTALAMKELGTSATWALQRQDDGTYMLIALSAGQALMGDLTLGAPSAGQSWLVEPDGTGRFVLRRSDTGTVLSYDSKQRVFLRSANSPTFSSWILLAK
jgi:hypothetical protein